MMAAMGAPFVWPSVMPAMNSTASASRRVVEVSELPGARLSRNAWRRSRSMGMPAGRPSTEQPMAGECDCPKMEMRKLSPHMEAIVAPYSSMSSTSPPSRR